MSIPTSDSQYLSEASRRMNSGKTEQQRRDERAQEADDRGSRYLGDANEANERGEKAKAEKLYARGQFWLDRYNKLMGNS